MNNISQHLFVPLTQKYDKNGYFSNSGVFTASNAYSTYPIQDYPQSPLINMVQLFNDGVGIKLRTWRSYPVNLQAVTSYGELVPTYLRNDVVRYCSTDLAGEYAVKLLFWKEPVSAVSALNMTVQPIDIDTELI